jgi:hypothetical protein
MLTLKRVKEIFPFMEDIEYKVIDSWNIVIHYHKKLFLYTILNCNTKCKKNLENY